MQTNYPDKNSEGIERYFYHVKAQMLLVQSLNGKGQGVFRDMLHTTKDNMVLCRGSVPTKSSRDLCFGRFLGIRDHLSNSTVPSNARLKYHN